MIIYKSRWHMLLVGMFSVVGLIGVATAAKASPPCQPNSVLDKGEKCDPVGPLFKGGVTCQTLGFDGGTLACTGTCLVDESGCSLTPEVVFPGDGYPNTPEELAIGTEDLTHDEQVEVVGVAAGFVI